MLVIESITTEHDTMVPPNTAIRLLLAAFAITATAPAAVIYNFAGTGAPVAALGPEPVAFQLTVPDFIKPPCCSFFVNFTCDQLDSNLNCLQFPHGTSTVSIKMFTVPVGFGDTLFFDASNDISYSFYFPDGAFGTPGTYVSKTGVADGSGRLIVNNGTLTVTVTPEPASVMLTVSAGLFLFLWKGRSSAGLDGASPLARIATLESVRSSI